MTILDEPLLNSNNPLDDKNAFITDLQSDVFYQRLRSLQETYQKLNAAFVNKKAVANYGGPQFVLQSDAELIVEVKKDNVVLRSYQDNLLMDFDFITRIRNSKDEKETARIKEEWLQAMKRRRPDVTANLSKAQPY